MSSPSVVRRASLGVVVVVTALAVTSCSGGESSRVEVGSVTRSTVTEVVEAPATVAARGSATVTSPADGTVRELFVADGDRVAKDELLMQLRSPEATQALAEARQADAQVVAAGAQPASGVDVSSSVKRSDKAAKQAFAQAETAAKALPDPTARKAALAQVANARAQYAAAREAVNQAVAQINSGVGSATSALSALTRAQRVQTRAAVAVAERTVDALDVRAPIAGTVSLGTGGAAGDSTDSSSGGLSSLLGQLPSSQQGAASSLLGGSSGETTTGDVARGVPVSTGQTLATVTDVSKLGLSAQVDETDVLLVKVGVRADAELAAVPGATYAARVTAVGLTPTTSARGGVSYVVRLSLGDGELADGGAAPPPRPGMSAVARLRVLTAREAVTVPSAAVFQDGARSSVWIVTDGVAHRRNVRLGAQGEATYQIRDGVEVGDRVVVRGADQVREGQKVG